MGYGTAGRTYFRESYIFYVWCLTCSGVRSPNEMPPDMRTVAVSGTLNTFQPRFSKKVASLA